MTRLHLVVAFRESGWRRPLTDPVQIEVFDQDGHLLATIPASHVLALIQWQLTAHTLRSEFAAYVEPPPPPPPRLMAQNGRRLKRRESRDAP